MSGKNSNLCVGAVLKMYSEKPFCLLWAFKRKVPQKSDWFFSRIHIVYAWRIYEYIYLQYTIYMYHMRYFKGVSGYMYIPRIYVCVCVCDAAIDSRQLKINMHQRAARTAVNMLAVLRFWSSHSHATRNRHDMPLISSGRPLPRLRDCSCCIHGSHDSHSVAHTHTSTYIHHFIQRQIE